MVVPRTDKQVTISGCPSKFLSVRHGIRQTIITRLTVEFHSWGVKIIMSFGQLDQYQATFWAELFP